MVVFGLLIGDKLPATPLLFAAVGILGVATVGWFDDRLGGLSPSLRIAIHLLAGLLLLPAAAGLELGAVSQVLAAVWWIFWTVSAINVVNFIDGIDGLIGAQALVFGSHLLLNGADDGSKLFGAVLAGASLGFLMLNWAPAKIFLGDVGSGALGAIFVLGGILYMRGGSGGLFAAFLPLCPIFLDASVTLLLRAYRREKLSEAHRSHLYQRLANGGLGHARVSLLYGLASVTAVLVVRQNPSTSVLTLLGFVVACATVGSLLLRAIQRPSQ